MNDLSTLYQHYVTGMVTGDIATLEKYLTDDFYLVHMSGLKQTKQAWLAAIDTGDMTYHKAVEDSIQVINANEILGRTRLTATIWGTHGTWQLESHLYCCEVAGRWLIDHIVTRPY